MKEIGGYLELDTFYLSMLHEEAIALNCGRNALAYLLQTKKIKKIWLPKFLCKSVYDVCKKENVEVKFYSINFEFVPEKVELQEDEWLYLVNYYGQLSNDEIAEYQKRYVRIIIDNTQSYFQMPVDQVDTLYTCRKYFGVADGAFLYTDTIIDGELSQDESFDRMRFVLGRYERTAQEFYAESAANNDFFENEPIKKMSKLTNNLLHAIDYEKVLKVRTENAKILHDKLKDINRLHIDIDKITFMYPLYIDNGDSIRRKLQKQKIYIPTLWPDVFDICSENETEYMMAKNILPLPIDQRYTKEDMLYILDALSKCIG